MSATLTIVKLTGTVKDGQIVVEGGPLPEGTPVIITVEERDLPPGPYVELDARGEPIVTPEFEAELDEAAAEVERGEWVSLDEFLARLGPT